VSGIIDFGTISRALVVLGAGGKVGRGVVGAALTAGHAVVAAGLDTDAAAELSAGAPQGRLLALPGTIASDADAAALAARLQRPGLSIEGVVASLAGSHPCGRLLDRPAEVLQRSLDQDLLPHLFAARHLLPLLGDDSAGYVLLGGPGGRYPWAGYGHCSIAAAALRMMARVLHDEAGRHGRRVQLLSMDAPLPANAADASAAALALGRRALAMLAAARHAGGAAVVDYVAPLTSDVIDTAPVPPRPSRNGHAPATTQLLPARDLRAARALLDSIASPTPPGRHDEHH